jgi:hypothetical protein
MATSIPLTVEGDDLWVRDVKASWFGGPDDPEDSGETASGVNTRLHPDILGCALPMQGFHHPATDRSPIPKLPWNTYVRVTNLKSNKTISVPLIDLGPSLTAASQAAIDLTETTFKQLGAKPAAGTMSVTYCIPGAARFLPADRRGSAANGLKTISLAKSLGRPAAEGAEMQAEPAGPEGAAGAKPVWPLQSQCDEFYGDPRGANSTYDPQWAAENLTHVPCPWVLTMGERHVPFITVHKKCSASLTRVLNNIWQAVGKDQGAVETLRYNRYDGSFVFRPMRDGHALSMHSYGIALDWDAKENPQHSTRHLFQSDSLIVTKFKEENWIWGGDWSGTSIDAMHFQAARVHS